MWLGLTAGRSSARSPGEGRVGLLCGEGGVAHVDADREAAIADGPIAVGGNLIAVGERRLVLRWAPGIALLCCCPSIGPLVISTGRSRDVISPATAGLQMAKRRVSGGARRLSS